MMGRGEGEAVTDGLGERVGGGGSVAAVQAVKISKLVRISKRFMWCSLVPGLLEISMPGLGVGVKGGRNKLARPYGL